MLGTPTSAWVRSRRPSTWAGSATSTGSAVISLGCSLAVSAAEPSSRSAATTRSPCAANASATALPIPDPAPVTTASLLCEWAFIIDESSPVVSLHATAGVAGAPGGRRHRRAGGLRRRTPQPPPGAPWPPRADDGIGVLGFCAVGRRSHHEGLSVSGVATTAWPFLTGTAVGWLASRGWRQPAAVLPTGVVVWLCTVAGGMVVRT